MRDLITAIFRLIGFACAIYIFKTVGEFDSDIISLGEFILRMVLSTAILFGDLEILSIRKENINVR